MSKFKVGDKVRATKDYEDDEDEYVQTGDVRIVEQHDPYGRPIMAEDRFKGWGWALDDLWELVEPASQDPHESVAQYIQRSTEENAEIARLQEELNRELFAWFGWIEGETRTGTAALQRAAADLQAALQPPKPEQKYKIYYEHGWWEPVDLERVRLEVSTSRMLFVHPIDPETGLAGPQLSKDELAVLLEDK